jgi:hypothetical protein
MKCFLCDTGENIMAGVAFFYLRFSTPEQAAGDSRRRQLAMAEKYASDHHLQLDVGLSFRDLGVSAYRGRNAKEGALRAFLDAIEHNLVPPSAQSNTGFPEHVCDATTPGPKCISFRRLGDPGEVDRMADGFEASDFSCGGN